MLHGVNVHYPKTYSKFLLEIHAFTQPGNKLLSFMQPEVQCMLYKLLDHRNNIRCIVQTKRIHIISISAPFLQISLIQSVLFKYENKFQTQMTEQEIFQSI